MNNDLLSLIAVNRDAIATNRGFYYQYLNVVLKWIKNYVNEYSGDVLTEVDEDIKEVGDKIVFTQLKCYASTFSFNSPEIQTTLLNFYYLYLRDNEQIPELAFQFKTNTSVSPKEKLLSRWIKEQPAIGGELTQLCIAKISGILQKEIKKNRDKRFNNNKLNQQEKSLLTRNFEELNRIAGDTDLLADFIGRITWEFAQLSPEKSIEALYSQIVEELSNPKFGSRPVKLIFEALLSEIYRKSQLPDQALRRVNTADLKTLLESRDEELSAYVDKRLINLLNVRIGLIEESLTNLREVVEDTVLTQKQQGEILEKLIREGGKEHHQVPRFISRVPFFESSEVVGRNETLSDLHKLLSEVRHVSINGNGGMGKSVILKYYLNAYEKDYDHIIWLNAGSGLVHSFIINLEIAQVLDLPIESENYAHRYSQILSRLQELPGNNVFVIDDYRTFTDELDELRTLSNWRIIVGTRLRMSKWRSITIGALSFEEAKLLYNSVVTTNTSKDDELQSFFDAVDYNTLAIRLVAKTLHHSLDLTLSKLMSCLENQDLDSTELQIDLPDEEGESPRLLNIIKATFDLGSLDQLEQYFMMFFAQLPSQDTDIQDLVDWYGPRKLSENKVQLTNIINRLHTKGLIERHRGYMNMHRMLQQAIFYQERQSERPFVSQFMNIPELTSRIHEGADHDINQALRYLKYGEAYLYNIKEKYRPHVYLAMLQLENEVLNIFNALYTTNDMVARWANLFDRAKKFLPAQDSLIGVIANNYGLALVSEGNLEQAIPLFDQASLIMEAQNEKALPQFLIALCNLCHLFIKRNEMQRFKECFSKIRQIREKHKLIDDVSLPIQSGVLGVANKTFGNYERAIEMFNFAINLHIELPKEKRNDLHLINYLISRTECYLQMKLIDKAEKSVISAVNVLSNVQAQSTLYLREVMKLLIVICDIKGDREKADQLRSSLENMGYYEGIEQTRS